MRYDERTATEKLEAIAAYICLTPEDFLNDDDSKKRRTGKWTEEDSERVLPLFEAAMNEDAPSDWRSHL